MNDLSTTYMGLSLKNPLIVSSCSLTGTLESVKRCAKTGVGAVVLKSLFEEQLQAETQQVEQFIGPNWHTEAYDYVQNMGMQLGPNAYLKLVEGTRKEIDIPVIASLNCVSAKWWVEYAKKLEGAGADALELNISFLPSDPQRDGREVENLYLKVMDSVSQNIRIPVAVKLGPYFSSLAWLGQELFKRGAAALVLFNRFYQVDIDVEKQSYVAGSRFSHPEEISLPLRWIALLSEHVGCDLASTTGVYDANGAIKMLLAGATVVEVCSTLFVNGLERITQIIQDLQNWMAKHNFQTIEQFRGKLSRERSEKTELLERLQYIKALVGVE